MIVLSGGARSQARTSEDFEGDSPFDKTMSALINDNKFSTSDWEGFYNCVVGIDAGYQLFLSKKDGFMFRQVGNSGYSNQMSGPLEYKDESVVLKGLNEGKFIPRYAKRW